MRICPKCNYIKTEQDDLMYPEYECPSCGIIEKHKAKFEFEQLEKKRAKERKAKLEKIRKEKELKQRQEEARKKREEEERLKQETEERLKREAEEQRRHEAAERQRMEAEALRKREEEERKQKAEQERIRKEEEEKRLLQQRKEKISNLANENADRIITPEGAADDYRLFDMCPFVISQAAKGLAIAGIGEKKNKLQHLRCMQKYCRLWTLKIDSVGKIYAEGCVMQFQGLTKEEIVRNFVIKNEQIIEKAHPSDGLSREPEQSDQ